MLFHAICQLADLLKYLFRQCVFECFLQKRFVLTFLTSLLLFKITITVLLIVMLK
jgi:hypothetical protein